MTQRHMKPHCECSCGAKYTFLGSITRKYKCPDCAKSNKPLTDDQQRLLEIIDSQPGEWVYPNQFNITAATGASLLRRGILERRYKQAPYYWSMYRRKSTK